ncbi:hypothetical protein [Fibrella aquatilis]|uniref:Uncharacterized protein n=1 Tax=Fibrella aquatilis TaxID=2817059 RepID=A0A939GBN0_9BACT|nr:hypothetical protein [Fibrella aquatilis]MBO0933885.1 hypothetical protein [Fibrella aquatilis]
MKLVYWLCLFGTMTAVYPSQAAGTQSCRSDSLALRSANALVADMARLIKQYAYFNTGMGAFSYDAWADTSNGLKLYVGERITSWGDRSEPDWYCIDFTHPVGTGEIKVVMGNNDNFFMEVAKRITHRTKNGRHKWLGIFFFTNRRKRTTDFRQLHDHLALIINQLTTSHK